MACTREKFDLTFFSNELRASRARKRMSQAELAQEAHISVQAISLYETARSTPSIDNVFYLAKVLDVDPNALIGWESS